MKLRLRGELDQDVDWTCGRIPQIAELFLVDAQWYRISNVAWALVEGGYDVALYLYKTNAPQSVKVKQ